MASSIANVYPFFVHLCSVTKYCWSHRQVDLDVISILFFLMVAPFKPYVALGLSLSWGFLRANYLKGTLGILQNLCDEKIQQLQQTLLQNCTCIESLQQTIFNLRIDLQKKEELLQQKGVEAEAIQSQRDRLIKELGEAKMQIEALQSFPQDLIEENQKLNEKLAAFYSQLQQLEGKEASWKDYAGLWSSLNEYQKLQHSKEMQNLQKRLTTMTATIVTLRAKEAQLSKDIEVLQMLLQRQVLLNEVDALSSRREALQGRLATLNRFPVTTFLGTSSAGFGVGHFFRPVVRQGLAKVAPPAITLPLAAATVAAAVVYHCAERITNKEIDWLEERIKGLQERIRGMPVT